MVDWEERGKERRQAGAGTEINRHTPGDLSAVRAATDALVLCRVNQWSPSTATEIGLAASLGADEVLLPMVRRPEEVDAALAVAGRQCGVGILVETTEAVLRVDELVSRPVSRVYVGLNDLAIDRGGGPIFLALVDGTVDRVAEATKGAGLPFGVAGLTVPEGGYPVPCRLLMGALARLGADFTFLRRSFYSDVAPHEIPAQVPRILAATVAARSRSEAETAADHGALRHAVDMMRALEAV